MKTSALFVAATATLASAQIIRPTPVPPSPAPFADGECPTRRFAQCLFETRNNPNVNLVYCLRTCLLPNAPVPTVPPTVPPPSSPPTSFPPAPTVAPPAPTPAPPPPMECPYPDLMSCIEDCPDTFPDIYAQCIDTCVAVCSGYDQVDIHDEEHMAKLEAFFGSSATPSTWSDCTVPVAPTSNRQITFDPAVPVSGENLIQLTGDVNIPVSGGSCPTTMTWNGVPILNDSFSVCGNSTIGLPINLGTLYITALPCPTTEGPVVIDIVADISPLAPRGDYVVEADCSTNDGTPLACAEVFMQL